MATCPAGHESASDDYCDECGIRIGAAPTLAAPEAGGGPRAGSGGDSRPGSPAGEGTLAAVSIPAETCPRCSAPRDGHFCEECGWNFVDGTGPALPPPATPLMPQAPAAGPPASPPGFPPVPPSVPSGSRAVPPPSPVSPPAPASPLVPAPPAAPAPAPAPEPPAAPESAPGPGDTRHDPAPVPPAPEPAAPGPSPSEAPAPGYWSATVTADRSYYEAVREATGPEADGIDFPSYCPERRFQLAGREMRIGRRSASRGIAPEIDLTGPPADPGVSRLHAVLIASGDGWAVLDPGSANGTLVNGTEIQRNEPVKLREGDRVNLGAWTRLIVSRDN